MQETRNLVNKIVLKNRIESGEQSLFNVQVKWFYKINKTNVFLIKLHFGINYRPKILFYIILLGIKGVYNTMDVHYILTLMFLHF